MAFAPKSKKGVVIESSILVVLLLFVITTAYIAKELPNKSPKEPTGATAFEQQPEEAVLPEQLQETNQSQTSQTTDQQPTFSTQTDNQTTSSQEFGAATTLSSCGTITSPGSYQLSQNVSSTGTCFQIQTSDIELDCAGFTIEYGTTTTGIGINVSNGTTFLSNITIKNCEIRKDSTSGNNNYGVQLSRASNSSIFNNTISTNGGTNNYGIYINWYSHFNNITSNTIASKGTGGSNIGIYQEDYSNSSNIAYNTILTNGTFGNHGILLLRSENSNITFNIIRTEGSSSSNLGIVMSTSTLNTNASNNVISTKGTTNNYGIWITNNQRNIAKNNNITTNGSSTGQQGIRIDGTASNSTISGNRIITGGTGSSYGIALIESTKDNIISSNNITTSSVGNNNNGIFLESISGENAGNMFSENEISTTANASHGILIKNSQNNTFSNNRVNVVNETSSEWRTETPTTPGSRNNTAINLTLVRNNITIHLTAFNGTEVKAVTTSEAASLGTPPGPNNKSLGKFTNITNSTGNAWLFINITYTDEEVAAAGIVESTLRIWRYNGTAWTNESFFAPGQYGVDTTNNFVFANITGFSTYGVFGAEFIELSSCGDITSSGRYKLIQNVSNGGTCFNINASNVELDCAGFTITYGTTTSGKGINVSSESSLLNDIAIKNCNIQKGAGGGDNNHGIQLESTSNSLIFNNTIATDGGQYNNGIRVSTSTNSNITLNTIRTNGVLSEYGINFYATNNSKITNNIIITNGSGSGNIGIAVFASFIGNEINNNRISTYGTYNNFGIFLSNSNSHIITNNNLTTNGSSTDQYGIYLDNSNNSTISGNIISTGGGLVTLGSAIGFLLTSSSNNTILSNLIKTSEKGYYNDGIHVMSNSNGNTFLENNITTTTFTSHGIIIQNAQNNTFNNNRVNVTNETSSEWRTETPTTPGSRNNTAINLTLVRNNITIHLTAFNGTEVKAVTTSEAASLGTPPGPNNKSLGKFANITNSTGNAWLFINITYTDEEVAAAGIVESTLRIWRYNGTAWTNESFFAPGQYGVDTTNNFVFANITGFSTYGVFGATPDTTPPSVFDPKPEPNSAFNTATTIEIAVNATDNVAVDKVYANITLPNGTQQQLSLTPATGNTTTASQYQP
ncbi:MAG: right-handed parallel beta-helix repeat-containing protein [Candidatus Woesearchaeota archaeon]